jgi:hypothetical protein
MKIKADITLCRKPAGRCARITKIDKKKKRALMREAGHGSFWVSMKTLEREWRSPGR